MRHLHARGSWLAHDMANSRKLIHKYYSGCSTTGGCTTGADIQSALTPGASIPFHKSSFVSIIVRQLLNNSIVSTSSRPGRLHRDRGCVCEQSSNRNRGKPATRPRIAITRAGAKGLLVTGLSPYASYGARIWAYSISRMVYTVAQPRK